MSDFYATIPRLEQVVEDKEHKTLPLALEVRDQPGRSWIDGVTVGVTTY